MSRVGNQQYTTGFFPRHKQGAYLFFVFTKMITVFLSQIKDVQTKENVVYTGCLSFILLNFITT